MGDYFWQAGDVMSTAAILFSIYFAVGLLALIVAVAKPGREKRTKGFETFRGDNAFDAGLLICITLFWPIWMLYACLKPERRYLDENSERKNEPK